MTPANKKTLSRAFKKATKTSPNADKPIEGMTIGGKPATMRLLITQSLNQDSFYSAVDKLLSRKGITLEKYINDTVAEFKNPRP